MPFYDEINDSSNFIISFTSCPKYDFSVYSRGYTQAANCLADLLLQSSHFSDYEAYPVVFLYRHALELSLKHIIYSSSRLAAFQAIDDIDGTLQNSHDLKRLAEMATSSLTRLFPQDESLGELSARVVLISNEFNNIDLRSDGYRYPIDSKGLPSTAKHQCLNLRAFAKHMSSLLYDLDTFHFGLNIETDKAQDIYEGLS